MHCGVVYTAVLLAPLSAALFSRTVENSDSLYRPCYGFYG